jgi:hypothetical protein
MTKTTSFQMDIRPLFTERDIQGMSKAFNLRSYDDVKKHAAAIYDRIRGIGGAVMPPPPPIKLQARRPLRHPRFASAALSWGWTTTN